MPDGKKIAETVVDASGNTTVTTTFEPNDSLPELQVEEFNVGPTVKKVETELPNEKRIVKKMCKATRPL